MNSFPSKESLCIDCVYQGHFYEVQCHPCDLGDRKLPNLEMCSRKICPYCKKTVTTGLSCSRCGSLLHKSCAERHSTDKSGVYKCCQGSRPISPSLLKVLDLLDQQADQFLLPKATQEPNLLNDTIGLGAVSHPSPALASGSADQAAALIIVDPQVNTEQAGSSSLDSTPSAASHSVSASQVNNSTLLNELQNLSRVFESQLRTTNDNLETIKNQNAGFSQRLDLHSRDIEGLKSGFTEYSTMLRSLEREAEDGARALASGSQAARPVGSSYVDLVAKMQERLTRSSNLIVYNLPEAGPNGDEPRAIQQLLSVVQNIDLATITTRRLGRNPSGDRPRPILVGLRSNAEVMRVIRNRHLLPRSISVSSDRTPAQRDELRQLREQADEHNRLNPTTRKTVKYVNGVPTLVDEDAPKRNQNTQPKN